MQRVVLRTLVARHSAALGRVGVPGTAQALRFCAAGSNNGGGDDGGGKIAPVNDEVEALVKALQDKAAGVKAPAADASGSSTATRDSSPRAKSNPLLLKASLAKLQNFAKGSDAELRLAGLNSYERRKVHMAAKALRLRTSSDDDKAVIVQRTVSGSSPPSKQAKDEGTSEAAEARFTRSPPASGASSPQTAADGGKDASSSKPPSATGAAATRSTSSTSNGLRPLASESGPLPDSPAELMASIDKLSTTLREHYARLRALHADGESAPVRLADAGTVAPECVDEIDGAAGEGGSAAAPNLAEPIGAQEIDYDAAQSLLRSIRPLTRVEKHVAITTAVGRIATVPERCSDDGNDGAEFVRVVLRVNSPIISDPEDRVVDFEVRAYCNVLGKFLSQHVREGDLVHIFGHTLPDAVDGKPVIVLSGDGCHASVIHSGV
jgi:hypothetical protein